MAKLSSINKNERRKKLVEDRGEVREAQGDRERRVGRRDRAPDRAPEDGRAAAQRAIRPAIRNRCELTGRSRAYYRKFRLSRIMLRELGNKGLIPVVIKSSW